MTVTLRALQSGDEETAVRWAADEVFCRAADWTPGLAPRVVRRHWQAIIAGGDPHFLRLGVIYGGALVGYVDLANLSAGAGELGVALGERSLWGCGIARQACEQLLTRAWALGLARVTAQVDARNDRSHALMTRLGFQESGKAVAAPDPGHRPPVRQYVLLRPR